MRHQSEFAENYPPPTNSRLEQILQPVSSDIENLESQIVDDLTTNIPLLNNIN